MTSTAFASQVGSEASARLKRRLEAHFGVLAAVCATGAMAAAEKADAGVVYSGVVNINVPITVAGVYLNLVTGVNATTPAGSPGWDINPWGTSTFFAYANNAAGPMDGILTGLGNSAALTDNLPAGTMIDGTGTYTRGPGSETTGSTVFALNSSQNLIGIRFQNEANGNQIHYGWVRMSFSTALNVAPRTVVEYAYEDQAGVGILAGTLPAAGVCCRGATCSTTVAQGSCTGSGTAGASFVTTSSVCNSGPISSTPCCYADYNKVGGLSVQDIFDFLGDWFASSPFANTGGNGGAAPLSVQNIFDFLTDWFAGGC